MPLERSNSRETLLPKQRYTYQYFSAILVCMSSLATGYSIAWIGPALLKFSQDPAYKLSGMQKSTLSSLFQIGTIPANIASFIASDRIGRMKTLLIAMMIMLMGNWVMVWRPKDIFYLYVSRLLNGVASGCVFVVLPVYLTEIASVCVRGRIISFFSIMMCLGALAANIIIPQTTVQWNGIIMAIPPVIFLLFAKYIPETPYYYLLQNQEPEAREALFNLRQQQNVDDELQTMKTHMTHSMTMTKYVSELFVVTRHRNMFALVLLIFFGQQAAGSAAINTYGLVMLREAPTFISSEMAGSIGAGVYSVMPFLCSYYIDRCGRRKVLIGSLFATSGTVFAIGLYFFVKQLKFAGVLPFISWLPTFSYIAFQMTVAFGLATTPYMYVSELFPTHLRTFVGCLVAIWGSILGIFFVFLHQFITDAVGEYLIYFIYTVCSVVNGILFLYLVPETKCQSLEQIQECMTSNDDDVDGVN